MRYILFILVLCSPVWAAGHLKCDYAAFGDPALWGSKLDEVPGLRDMVVRLLADPDVDPEIRNLIAGILSRPDVTIRQLTDQIRQQTGLSPTKQAQHTYLGPAPFRVILRPKAVTSGKGEPARMDTYRYAPGHTILVQDRPLTAENNDLSILIHEMAHIHFRAYLNGHLEHLARIFPPDLIQQSPDGKYEIDEQLYYYLQERYAWEMQRRSLQALHGRYFDEWYRIFGPVEEANNSDPKAVADLATRVSQIYGITDPRLLALNQRSLSDILDHGMASALNPRPLPSSQLQVGMVYRFGEAPLDRRVSLMNGLVGYPVELWGMSPRSNRGVIVKTDPKAGEVRIRQASGEELNFDLTVITRFQIDPREPLPVSPPVGAN